MRGGDNGRSDGLHNVDYDYDYASESEWCRGWDEVAAAQIVFYEESGADSRTPNAEKKTV